MAMERLASLTVSGFQEDSEKVALGFVKSSSDRMAAKEDVMTTRLTDGADRLTASRMPRVPLSAGVIISFWASVKVKNRGLAV